MSDCECLSKCSNDIGMVNLIRHHEYCPKRGDDAQTLRRLVSELVRGMEKWAWDEDGIHHEAWDAYVRGKALLLEAVEMEEA